MPLVKKTVSSKGAVELTVDSPWVRVKDGEELPDKGALLVPLSVWLTERDALRQRPDAVGVWLSSDTDASLADWAETISEDLFSLPVVAVDFPAFGDGRGYSLASLLRQRHGFTGELRAIGDVLVDQVPAMVRVGFDAFDVVKDEDVPLIETALTRFSHVYQTATDGRRTIWQRRGGQGERINS